MVQEIIYKQGKWPSYEKPMLKLKACWEGDATPFGCGYTCAIGDTVTEGNTQPNEQPKCGVNPFVRLWKGQSPKGPVF